MNIVEDIVAFGISANNEIAKRDQKIAELEQVIKTLQQQINNNKKKD